MPRLSRFVATTALGLLALPAAAQDRAAVEAWETLRETLEVTGLQVTVSGSGADGGALVLHDLVVRPADAPMSMILRMPSLTIEALPDGRFLATPAPVFDLDLRDARQRLTRLQITHDGALDLSLAETGAALGVDFPSLRVTQTPGAGGKPVPGQTAVEALDIGLSDFTGRIDMTIGATIGLEALFNAARLAYDLDLRDDGASQSSVTEIEDLRVEFHASEIPMDIDGTGFLDTAFANGFGARLTVSTGFARGEADQDLGGLPVRVISTNASSALELALEDGMLGAEMSAEELAIEVNSPFLSTDGRIESILIAGEMPLIVDTRDHPFRVALGLRELRVGQALWAMAGAPGLAADTLTFAVDLQGNGRWLVPLDMIDQTNEPPLDLTSVVLNELTVRFGDAALTGDGQFDLAPGSFAMDGPPDGTGLFAFELRGGERLLERLSQTPLLPADQAFLVRAMLGALGRSVGEDHLASDVSINPGGEVLINGQPLPF